jgi:hypothetical protein
LLKYFAPTNEKKRKERTLLQSIIFYLLKKIKKGRVAASFFTNEKKGLF